MIAKLRARKRSSTSGCMIMFSCLAYAAPLGGTGEQIDRQTGVHLMPPQEHTPVGGPAAGRNRLSGM